MLNKRLKEQREQLKLSQNDVAEKLHVSPQSISKWERGIALPSVEFLPKLAKIYKCKIDDFFSDKNIVEGKNITISGATEEFFTEIGKIFNEYQQGKKFVIKDIYNGNMRLLQKVLEFLVVQDVLTISMLQRRFQIGYARAASLLDGFERLGLIEVSRTGDIKRCTNREKVLEFLKFLSEVVVFS